ncbi:MAG: hypothetical protein ACT4P0_03945 [Panacagrimonas sp.]
MTTQSNAFNSSDGTGNRRLALDNLIRRELKVGDPSNAGQIAQALLSRYSGDPRAQAIASEARGMPFLQTQALGPVTAPRKSATEGDLMEAMDDVNKDLQVLLDSNLLKDAVSELRGWAAGIRSVMNEAVPSARQAIDRQQRDKTFALRRQLGDYARLARLAGVLTPASNDDYRSLAGSLDEVANVLLVVMGEALSEHGLESGDYIPEAPLSELEGRRSMVLSALRNLTGGVAASQDQSTWPWGINAYGRLLTLLNQDGQAELRSLLTEAELGRVMDSLVSRAGNGEGDGLRALGATAQIELGRMRRLIAYWPRLGTKSPAMANFLRALELFVAAFDSSAGSRLLVIARPPILAYGIAQRLNRGTPAQRLQMLALLRAQFAADVDCFLACGCGDDTEQQRQVILDKLLYDLDRSVDLYALGIGPPVGVLGDFGPVEWRALGYSRLFSLSALDIRGSALLSATSAATNAGANPVQAAAVANAAVDAAATGGTQAQVNAAAASAANQQGASVAVAAAVVAATRIVVTLHGPLTELANNTDIPSVPGDRIREAATAELHAQVLAEANWWVMVEAMSPSCSRQQRLRDAVTDLLNRARVDLDATDVNAPQLPEIRLPADSATGMTVLAVGTDEVW